MVPDHPTQQPDIGPARITPAGSLQLADGLQVETELVVVWNAGGQTSVETMESIEQNQASRLRLEPTGLRASLAGSEIVDRHVDATSPVQLRQVLVDERQVHGLRCLEVVVPEFILGVELQIEEVVVQRQRDDVQTGSLKQSTELVGGRRLARRAGARHDDEA